MDVPFASSGAISRAHYALVRKVELATSPQLADQYIGAEVEAIHERLTRPTLSLNQCKESLVLLMYCAMTASSGLEQGTDFAFPHAINLAASGTSIKDKRIGYLFCSEMMPSNHELKLLLVNTIRKDLESVSVPCICLALEILIQSPFDDVIPAVQDRLYALLSHNSPDVRRRALFAFRSLMSHENSLMAHVTKRLEKRLRDPHPIVISAALTLTSRLAELGQSVKSMEIIQELLKASWRPDLDRSEFWFILKVLQTMRFPNLTQDSLHILHEIILWAVHSRVQAHALLYASFLVLRVKRSDVGLLSTMRPSPVIAIRDLLVSDETNDQYLFLSCLECLDPALWAGTTNEIPSVMEAWEVERVMRFLDSRDQAILKKTLRILHSVDPNIIASYYAHALEHVPPFPSLGEENEYCIRLLEAAEILAGSDGKQYATHLTEILLAVQGGDRAARAETLDRVVEAVLHHVRSVPDIVRSALTHGLLDNLKEKANSHGPTFLLVSAALACERAGDVHLDAPSILDGLAHSLRRYRVAIQDACLLAMLRLAATCEVSDVVRGCVQALSDHSSRYIRKRCSQFISLCDRKDVLNDIVSHTPSSTLPEFAIALETHHPHHSSAQPLEAASLDQASSPQMSFSASQLRYAAYEPPRPVPKLRQPQQIQRTTSTSTSSNTGHSEKGSDLSSISSPGRPCSSLSDEPLSRTVSAGELAIVAGDSDLQRLSLQSRPSSPDLAADTTFRADLIAFDLQVKSDPANSASGHEPPFEAIWSALEHSNTRGWCEASVDGVVRRLQTLKSHMRVIDQDQPPFQGDLKIILSVVPHQSATTGLAVLRLRESDDESSLWLLRSDNAELVTGIKALLND